MRNPRFACAFVRNFALELWRSRQSGLRSGAVALAERPGDTAVLSQCSDEAAHAGVRPGMTTAQGHSLCPDLQVITLLDVSVDAESQKLLRHLQNLSPEVEARAPGTYLLLASGLARLYGSETGFAETVITAIRTHGLPVAVGVADTPTAAQVAARISAAGTFTVIPRGRETHFLGPLDVDYLQPTPGVKEQLKSLGLSTIAQVATLPAGELVRRFGREGALLHRLAHGIEQRRFDPAALPSDRVRNASFTFPLTRLPALVAHLTRLTDELFGGLGIRGDAAAALHVDLHLEHGAREHLLLTVSRPVVSAAPFLRQVNERLRKIRFISGVSRLSVTLGGVTRITPRQLELRQTEGLRAASAGVRPEVPLPTAVPPGIPRLVASHLPEESFEISACPGEQTRPPGVGAYGPAYAAWSLAGLRLISPPHRTTVTERQGMPQAFHFESRMRPVRARRGPWEISGRWWGDDFDRRYFEIQTDGAERYLLFFDRGSARWYLQGIFD